MPNVTGNVRTWGFVPFPTSARLLMRFVPSGAGFSRGTLFPLREETVEPAADGSFSVQLAQTTAVLKDVWFTIRFEWFATDPTTGEADLAGWSDIPGKLRVPSSGGDVTALMEATPAPGAIVYGFGAPPDSLTGVTYWDLSGAKPTLYLPKGAMA